MGASNGEVRCLLPGVGQEQYPKLAEHLLRELHDVTVREAAEVVAAGVRLAFAAAVLLPGVAGGVIPVAIEFHGEPMLRPPAVDAAAGGEAVADRERQSVLAKQLEKATLELAERDVGVTAKDAAQLSPSPGVRAAPQH